MMPITLISGEQKDLRNPNDNSRNIVLIGSRKRQ